MLHTVINFILQNPSVILLIIFLIFLSSNLYWKLLWKYYRSIVSPQYNRFQGILLFVIQSIYFIGLYFLSSKMNLANIFSTNDSATLLGVAFTVISVYAIIFSISQFLISSKKGREKIWGIYMDGRPVKLAVLEEIEQLFLFRLILLYFIVFPLFWGKGVLILQNLWIASLIFIIIAIYFNLTWGFSSMREVNRDGILREEWIIQTGLSDEYMKILYKDLVSDRLRKFDNCIRKRIELIEDEDEIQKFIISIYADSHLFFYIWFSKKNKFSPLLKWLTYPRLLLKTNEEVGKKYFYFQNDFWKLIDDMGEKWHNENYLYVVYDRTLELLCDRMMESDNQDFIGGVLYLERILNNSRNSYNRLNKQNSSILFPGRIFSSMSSKASYWRDMNWKLVKLARLLRKLEIKLKIDDRNNFINFRNGEKDISEVMSANFIKTFDHELSRVEINPDVYFLSAQESYGKFIDSIIFVDSEFTIEYLERKMKDNVYYHVLNDEQVKIIEQRIKKEKDTVEKEFKDANNSD
ncbi:hypothetical protein DXX96_03305 [Lactococcus petauri]|nr:hypothetical protein [Lactococcus petauri]